jgi:hypothetical protein
MCVFDYCVCVCVHACARMHMHAHWRVCTGMCACACVPVYVVQLFVSLRPFFGFSGLVFIIQETVTINLVSCYSH